MSENRALCVLEVLVHLTDTLPDKYLARKSSAVLWVPSVVVGEQNLLCNPEHPYFARIHFYSPVPFVFDMRLSSVLARVDPASK
jgi:RES domain-containing protein